MRAVLVWGTFVSALWCTAACNEDDPVFTADDEAGSADSDAGEDGDGATQPGRGTPMAADATGTAIDAGDGDADRYNGPPPLITAKGACDMRAERQCGRLAECANFRLRALYGKVETCRARVSAACTAEALLDDSGHTTYTLLRCAQDTSSASCADVIGNHEPMSCKPAGRRRDGLGCGAHTQCVSTYCALGSEGCGTCQPRQRVDESCGEDAHCVDGLVCSTQGKCAKPGELAASCDDRFAPCRQHLACVEGRCSNPLPPGVPCQSTRQCAQADGFICASQANLAFAALSCRSSSTAATGEVCQVDGNVVAHCQGGPSLCAKDTGGTFRCMSAAKDGEACGGKAQGAGCEAGARCIGGACKLGPVASCGT